MHATTRQRLARLQRLAVTGIDVPDLPLRNHHQRQLVNPILPAPEERMDAAAQECRLVSGFAPERDEVPFRDRAASRPELLDDADAIVGNIANPQQDRDHDECHPDEEGNADPAGEIFS